MIDVFEKARPLALPHIQEWLPGGYVENGQWVVKNPTRNDSSAGSFKINLTTGAWSEYADDTYGHDAISLFAYLNGMRNFDAAREILARYDPTYFPSGEKENHEASWYQLSKGSKDAPILSKMDGEITRWELETQSGKNWRTCMVIIRYKNGDGKKDIPYTLWTDGRRQEWRSKALKNAPYPLYGLRRLVENPNAPVILYEGQKCASIVQPLLDEYACVGWYGGAGNLHLSDTSHLVGREIWYPFDADRSGRATLENLEALHAKVHIVYPPLNMPKGWDHADGVRDGWRRQELLEALSNTSEASKTLPAITATMFPENKPTLLSTPISDEMREIVQSKLFREVRQKDGSYIIALVADWIFQIVELDPVIRSSIRFDYTIGTEICAYDNHQLLKTGIKTRLYEYGVPFNFLTDRNMDAIVDKVNYRAWDESCYNSVTSFIDSLMFQYPNQDSSVLDEFMQVFRFNVEKMPQDDTEIYNNRCEKVIELYSEFWHKFFLRLAAHIKGTRRDKNHLYLGLIENDIVPILEGPQGSGKTTFCKWLAIEDDFYVDLGSGMKSGFGSAESVKKIRGHIICEIGEMKIMKTSDYVETIKSFISSKTFIVDIKFKEGGKALPMTASFIGTSNPAQYLSDESGNRRFWPVRLRSVDMEFIKNNPTLPGRLYSYYSKLVANMSMSDIYDSCKPSDELVKYIDELREDAMITYSDNEIAIKMIKEWKAMHGGGGMLDKSTIEKMATDSGYITRISPRAFNMSIKKMGFIQKRVYDPDTKSSPNVWVWEPDGVLPLNKDAPF